MKPIPPEMPDGGTGQSCGGDINRLIKLYRRACRGDLVALEAARRLACQLCAEDPLRVDVLLIANWVDVDLDLESTP